jgi:hypothetical protein
MSGREHRWTVHSAAGFPDLIDSMTDIHQQAQALAAFRLLYQAVHLRESLPLQVDILLGPDRETGRLENAHGLAVGFTLNHLTRTLTVETVTVTRQDVAADLYRSKKAFGSSL